MEKYKLRILDIVEEAVGTKSYYFGKPAELDWQEGAHVHIGHVGFDEGELPNKALVRHMSITTLPSENKLGITTKVPGSSSEFKRRLSGLGIGDEVIFFKFGSRMYLRRVNRPLILLSMGVGMSTIRPLILAYINDSTNVPTLINVHVNSTGEFLFRDELDPHTRDSYINYWLKSRHDFDALLSGLHYKEEAIFYVVGSDEFMKESIKILNRMGVRNEDIILDRKEEKLREFFIN
jgi:ferredoxin--NADP+ reductase